jgi:allantoin racemase
MRIWLQKHIVAGRLPLLDQLYDTHLGALVPSDVELEIATLPPAAYPDLLPADYVAYGQVEELFAMHFAAQALVAERSGADAYIIATSQDPGIVAARRLVSIPDLGYGETAFGFCAMRRIRFGIVGFIPALQEILEANIRSYGADPWYRGARYLPGARATVEATLAGESEDFLREFEQCAAQLAAEGAQILIAGEGVPNELLHHFGIDRIAGVEVLDANGLVVRMAEFIVRAEQDRILPRITSGYDRRRVEDAALDHFVRVFAPISSRDALVDGATAEPT